MKQRPRLDEAMVILSTFKLAKNRPAFTAAEITAIRENKAASAKRMSKLLKECNDPILKEDAQVLHAVRRQVVKEMIKLERFTILEAGSALSVEEMVQQIHGMTMALTPLTRVSESLSHALSFKADRAQAIVSELEDNEANSTIGLRTTSGGRSAMKELQSLFADIAGMVKGCIAISDSLTDGKLAEILNPIMHGMKGQKGMVPLLKSLAQYDDQVKGVGANEEGPGGIGGQASGALSFLAKSAKGVSKAEDFKRAFTEAVRSKAPGFAKIAEHVGAELMEVPLPIIMKSFRAFDSTVANDVDLDLIMSMTKTGFGAAVKNLFGGLGAGKMGGVFGGGKLG